MNITLPPQVARFIRGKVKAGEYLNESEAISDAVRHMQKAESDDVETSLTAADRQNIRTRVQQGIRDVEEGRYEEFDEPGLRAYFAGISERGKRRLRK